jgi:hypothetical protein
MERRGAAAWARRVAEARQRCWLLEDSLTRRRPPPGRLVSGIINCACGGAHASRAPCEAAGAARGPIASRKRRCAPVTTAAGALRPPPHVHAPTCTARTHARTSRLRTTRLHAQPQAATPAHGAAPLSGTERASRGAAVRGRADVCYKTSCYADGPPAPRVPIESSRVITAHTTRQLNLTEHGSSSTSRQDFTPAVAPLV